MTAHRLQITALAPLARIITIATLWLVLAWSTERNAIHAYSIVPSSSSRGPIRKGTNANAHVHRGIQPLPAFHRPASRQRLPDGHGSLSVARSTHDCVSNSTAMGTAWPEARTEDSVLDEERERELRLLRSMLEAMADLESFQESSGDANANANADASANTNANANANANQPRLLSNAVQSRTRYGYDNDSSDTTVDASLFFPRMAAETAVVDSETGAVVVRKAPPAGTEASGADTGIEERTGVVQADDDAVWRARWLLVAAAALYGTNFSVVKLLGDEMPVSISTSFRFGLAALATLPWLLEGILPLPNQKGTNGDGVVSRDSDSDEHNRQRFLATMYGLEVGLWNSIGYVAQAVGLETTLASKSAFLCSMAVVIVPLLDCLAGKRLLPRQWAGALMALVGVAFLELGGVNFDLLSSGGGITVGDKLSLIQPFTFGLGFWRMEQAMHRFPREAQRMTAAQLMAIFASSVCYGLWSLGVLDQSGATGIAGLESSLSVIATSFPWHEWFTSPSILFSLFWTGCITTALTIYMETLALESLSAAETTLIFSTEPLWGTAVAVAVMGEQMGLNAVVGATLILAACIFSNLGIDGLREFWKSATESVFADDNDDRSRNRSRNRNRPTPNAGDAGRSSPTRFLTDNWALLSSGVAGVLAIQKVALGAASQTTQEVEEIVDGLIENLADKL